MLDCWVEFYDVAHSYLCFCVGLVLLLFIFEIKKSNTTKYGQVIHKANGCSLFIFLVRPSVSILVDYAGQTFNWFYRIICVGNNEKGIDVGRTTPLARILGFRNVVWMRRESRFSCQKMFRSELLQCSAENYLDIRYLKSLTHWHFTNILNSSESKDWFCTHRD